HAVSPPRRASLRPQRLGVAPRCQTQDVVAAEGKATPRPGYCQPPPGIRVVGKNRVSSTAWNKLPECPETGGVSVPVPAGPARTRPSGPCPPPVQGLSGSHSNPCSRPFPG